MKRRSVVILIMMVVLLFGVIMFISIPKHELGTYKVCSMEGEVKEVIFDITIYGGILKNRGIAGKIVFDGIEYISVEDAYKNGPSGRGQFVIPTLNPFDITESVYIVELGEYMEYIWLHEVSSKTENVYFGPAETKERATEIMKIIERKLE